MRSQLFVKSLLTPSGSARSIILIICAVSMLMGLPRLASYFRTVEEPRLSHEVVLIQPQPAADVGTIKTRQPPAPLAPFADHTQPAQPVAAPSAATEPEIIAGLRDDRSALNLQAAQDLINGRIPAVTIPPAANGVQSEGYLPPWQALHARDTAQSLTSKPGDEAALTMPIAAQPTRADLRRPSKKRSTYARRKVKVPSSPFGGLFGF